MKSLYDLQSLSYLVLQIGIVAVLLMNGFWWPLYGALLYLMLGTEVIHHNHVHLGIWHSKSLNGLTSLVISVLTAVPSAMMFGGHVKNHHRHQHGPEDITRTYRFGGDHNHFLGYLLHPLQAFTVLIRMFWQQFVSAWPMQTRFARSIALQVIVIVLCWSALCYLDWQKFLLFVLVPQLFGLHWLLATNYLQHAHCNDESKTEYARNFTGGMNWLLFNIGFHTAHHDYPKVHWSKLRGLHREKYQNLDSTLCIPSLLGYFVRTFFLSPFVPSLRSRTLKRPVEFDA